MKKWGELVELRTKLASILPFLLGIGYVLATWHRLNLVNTILFGLAMLAFDMATTALDNLMHYRHAKDAAYRQHVNIIGRAALTEHAVIAAIVALVIVATGLGLWLVWRTAWVLLVLGMACFAVGLGYTWGPLPLARLPIGEVFSGLTMGLGIPFITVYVNVPATRFLAVRLAWPDLSVTGALPALAGLCLIAVMPMATIANVMLANNLADLSEDTHNHRLTLPMYLGHRASRWVYLGLAVIGYFAVVAGVVARVVPTWSLVCGVSLPAVWHRAQVFIDHPDKTQTFHLAIQNLVLANGSLLAGLVIAAGVSL